MSKKELLKDLNKLEERCRAVLADANADVGQAIQSISGLLLIDKLRNLVEVQK